MLILMYSVHVYSHLPNKREVTLADFDLTKLLILLPLRDNSNSTFQCETPCTKKISGVSILFNFLFSVFRILQLKLSGCA